MRFKGVGTLLGTYEVFKDHTNPLQGTFFGGGHLVVGGVDIWLRVVDKKWSGSFFKNAPRPPVTKPPGVYTLLKSRIFVTFFLEFFHRFFCFSSDVLNKLVLH